MNSSPSSSAHNQQPPDHQQHGQRPADVETDSLCSDVHCSLMRAIDSTYNMPLSEHILYSSYESYDNIMTEQRRLLDQTMSKLSECSDGQQSSQYYTSSGGSLISKIGNRCIDYGAIENLRDKYDTIHEFSEQMFDRIGQNLDDASGITSRDAQLIQATLGAANQHKLTTTTTTSSSSSHIPNKAQSSSSQSRNLSSSSSSSSLTRPIDTNPSSVNAQQLEHNQQQEQYYRNQQTRQNYKFNRKPQAKVVSNNNQQQQQQPVNNVVQSFSMQQQKSQYGGYLGKQQYSSPNQRFAMLENKSIARPQDQFKDRIDNSYRPFEPLIREKHNAQYPLTLELKRDEHGNEYYSHPYEYEIQEFQVPPELLTFRDPIEPPVLDSTPIFLVETVQQLDEMCKHIEAQTEFAVDVEHHSYRSFQGITCLLQISTREQDFVIDAIKLRSELHRLNRSFTNPRIVKVFHGADCDILWLQRDFGVYVVNLFDTSRAAKLMKFAHLSLAFLMKHYCDKDPDKSYQLADWRERPLPLPMLQYAREDTHYLLYIYDRLRNDLLKKGGPNRNIGKELLSSVFERGKEICLKRYEKPPFSDTSHMSVLRKSRTPFGAKNMFAFKELYAWRDAISRELDESVGYVLPNNLMIRFAQYLPREPQSITALCNPIPPTVKKYLSDIHAIILKAIDVPDETSKVMSGIPLNVDPSLRSIDLDSISHKQDIAHSAGLQESSVPNLLDKMYLLNCSNDEKNGCMKGRHGNYQNGKSNLRKNINQSPSRLYNFLDSSWSKGTYKRQDNINTTRSNVHDSIQQQFVSPYRRYESRNK